MPVDRLWHAVPCFPTISEVWLRLLESYREQAADSNQEDAPRRRLGSGSTPPERQPEPSFGLRITLSPYKTGIPGMYICSTAAPPGPGAHGMCGANAADVAHSELT